MFIYKILGLDLTIYDKLVFSKIHYHILNE